MSAISGAPPSVVVYAIEEHLFHLLSPRYDTTKALIDVCCGGFRMAVLDDKRRGGGGEEGRARRWRFVAKDEEFAV